MSSSNTRATVDVFELARSNGVVEGRVPFDAANRLRPSLRNGAGAIEYRLQGLIDDHGRPAARLLLRAELPLTCDRCEKAMTLPLEHEAAFYFLHDESEVTALPVSADELAEPLIGSSLFDVATLVEDETILCIPVSPRHAECKVQMDESQSTTRSAGASPFAGLAGLLRKNGR